jgi:hypothetical protein
MSTKPIQVGALLVLGVLPLRAQEPAPASTPARAPIAIHSVEAGGAKVFFQNVPWGPQTFATMERADDSFYNKRSWPFARLETGVPLTLDGTRLAPGNYALVFNPASVEQPSMSLEVLRVEPGEFFQAGNPMTRAPQGESVYKARVTFEKAAETAPALHVALRDGADGLRLAVAYGDRRLNRTLAR